MKKIPLCCLVLLAGCASTPPTKIGADTYFSSKTNSAGIFGSVSAVAGNLIKNGTQFCAKQGKGFEMVTSHVTPMGLGALGDAAITFKCINNAENPVQNSTSDPTNTPLAPKDRSEPNL